MVGAFAMGAVILLAMFFIAGRAFGGAIFDMEAFELEILELEAARDFGVTLFFVIGFFAALRTDLTAFLAGFVVFLAGFATARFATARFTLPDFTVRSGALRDFTADLLGAFFAVVLVRLTDFDFFAFAIGCFRLSLKTSTFSSPLEACEDGIFKR
jgi:hypothetical protein